VAVGIFSVKVMLHRNKTTLGKSLNEFNEYLLTIKTLIFENISVSQRTLQDFQVPVCFNIVQFVY